MKRKPVTVAVEAASTVEPALLLSESHIIAVELATVVPPTALLSDGYPCSKQEQLAGCVAGIVEEACVMKRSDTFFDFDKLECVESVTEEVNKLVAVFGDRQEPVNWGGMCDGDQAENRGTYFPTFG